MSDGWKMRSIENNMSITNIEKRYVRKTYKGISHIYIYIFFLLMSTII